MRTPMPAIVWAMCAAAAIGIAGCQKADNGVTNPPPAETTKEVKPPVEHPAAKTPAGDPAQAKPKDHPAH